MRYLFCFAILSIVWNSVYAQSEPFDTLMNRGKSQFEPDLEKPDYAAAINNLKKAIVLKPENSEAHYYLGYAYSRFNSTGSETIPDMQMPLVQKASTEFEKTIAIAPMYSGEVITLDPYSKITSEWGALALCYLSNNKTDSAKWAFAEGRRRGGFDDFILAMNRAVLNSCSKNAIIISSGDNYTFPLYYLQISEKLRTDVCIVDVGLVSAKWYPRFIEKTTKVKFGIPEPALDTIDYKDWSDSIIKIPIYNSGKVFSWTLKPSYEEHYILRGDRILLALLEQNKFQRDIFFTKNFIKSDQLSLTNHLLIYPNADKVNAGSEPPIVITEYISKVKKSVPTFDPVNRYSPDEIVIIDGLRNEIFRKIGNCNDDDPLKNELLTLIKDYLSPKKFPSFSDEVRKKLSDYNIY